VEQISLLLARVVHDLDVQGVDPAHAVVAVVEKLQRRYPNYSLASTDLAGRAIALQDLSSACS
jgi:hypothetical protein